MDQQKIFRNPACKRFPETIPEFSPFAGTRYVDLRSECTLPKTASFLLPRCDNILDVLFTISEIQRTRKLDEPPGSVTFDIAQDDPSVLARYVIFMSILDSCTDIREDAKFLWVIWYDMEINETQLKRLQEILNKLAGGDLPSWLSISNDNTLASLNSVLCGWRDLEPKRLDALREVRKSFMVEKSFTFERLSRSITEKVMVWLPYTLSMTKQITPLDLAKPVCLGDGKCVSQWVSVGTTMSGGGLPNPTFLRHESGEWCVQPDLHPLAAFDVCLSDIFDKTIVEEGKSKLQQMLTRWRNWRKRLNKIQVNIWLTDALDVCSEESIKGQQFNIIHTKTLSDEVGLLNLIICFGPLLKRPDGVLVTQSLTWDEHHHDMEDFVQTSIGCPPNLCPTIFAVRLGETFELGTPSPPWMETYSPGMGRTLRWVAAESNITHISLEGRQNLILDVLKTICRECTKVTVNQQGPSQMFNSVSTALALLSSFQHKCHMPGRNLLAMMKTEFPRFVMKDTSKAYDPLLTSTRAFAVVFDLENLSPAQKLVIAEVTLQTDPNFTSSGSPVTSLMLIEDGRDKDILHVVDLGEVPKTYGKVHIFQNLCYSHRNGQDVLSIPILKEDFESLDPGSVLILFDKTKPTVSSQFLNISKLRVVKEVELPSVGSDQGNEYVEEVIIHENESKFHVHAKFLPNKCRGTLRFNFVPSRRPTKMGLKFSETSCSDSLVVEFSCQVDGEQIHVEPAKVKGQVNLHLPKDLDHTSGALCLPVEKLDFQALTTVEINKFAFWTQLSVVDRSLEGNILSRLQSLVSCIFIRSIIEKETVRFYILETPRPALGPFGRCDDLFIHIKGVYLIGGVVTLYVKWLDPTIARELIQEKEMTEADFRGLHVQASPSSELENIYIEIQQPVNMVKLLKKLLVTNTARTVQPEDCVRVPCQFASYLQIIHRRKMTSFVEDIKRRWLLLDGSRADADVFQFVQSVVQEGHAVGNACAQCGKRGARNRCQRCKVSRYCNQNCQKRDWPQHKLKCKRMGEKK